MYLRCRYHFLFNPSDHNFSLQGLVSKFETLGIQSYSQLMIGMFNHLLSIVFGFQYHSQEVIGSLGKEI